MNGRGHTAFQQDLAEFSKRLHRQGWVANHDGNISVRASDGVRFYATPTATAKSDVTPSDIVIVDIEGKKLSGRKRLFSEWHLHATCFKARPDVHVVMHAHPVACTALGLAGHSIGVPQLPEMLVSLGANIPLIPFAMPKSAEQERVVARELTDGDADAMLIARNGAITVGSDIEQAYLRMELIEHYAKILLAARPLGSYPCMSDADVKTLLDKRASAGLGKRGRQG